MNRIDIKISWYWIDNTQERCEFNFRKAEDTTYTEVKNAIDEFIDEASIVVYIYSVELMTYRDNNTDEIHKRINKYIASINA